MNVQILENGDLKLSLESDDDFGQLKIDSNSYGEFAICDLLEPYSCNGSFAFFDASDGNPCVGLTDAPCIAEQLDWDDEGNAEIIGNFWYYDDYMVKSFIDELLNDGEVTFTLAK